MIKLGLGRIHSPDHRDKQFTMAEHVALAEVRGRPLSDPRGAPDAQWWQFLGFVLDQGPHGTCVGHGWEHWLRTAPIETLPTEEDAVALYRAARVIDGQDPDDLNAGSSVRAGAQAIQARGQLDKYVWAWSLSDVVAWVLTQGPVVLGTNWYSSMFEPEFQTGLVTITPTATIAGGHCYTLDKVDNVAGICGGLNSWGTKWGDLGRYTMTFETLERLLKESGEACSAIQTVPTNG